MKKLFFPFLLLLYACTDESRVIDQMTDIPEGKWFYNQIADYPFTVDDASVYYDFNLKLRIQKSYPYENLYLLAHIKTPDGKVSKQRVNFTLTDETGKPLGRSSGSVVDYDLPMFKDRKMGSVGQYVISIEQNMRDSVVNGIESIGVKIRKGNPVF